MAVLEIVSNIRRTLGNALSYIQNARKTTLPDGTRLVTSNMGPDTNPSREARRMLEEVKQNQNGVLPSSRVAQHLVQSWPDSDGITPQKALELARQMADEITGGTRLYVIAVHVSQARLHAHIIIANHDQRTGGPNRWGPKDLQRWRRINDRISRENHLSTLPDPQIGHRIPATDTTRQRIGSLYAQATGASWVEQVKNTIDDAGVMSGTFAEFRASLHEQGISVIPRGRHFTYMLTEDGTKIRDTRLGIAYTPANVLTRITKRPVTEISFSRRLVVRHRNGTTRIMIPGTHGDKRMTISDDQIIKTGPNSWRAFIPQDRPVTLTDRRGRLAGRIRCAALTTRFIQPGADLEHEYRTIRPAITTAQAEQANRAYVWQARHIARMNQQAQALRIVEANDAGGHDARRAIDSLLGQIGNARSDLSAQIAAMAEARSAGSDDPLGTEDATMRGMRTQQIQSLERRIEELSWQIRTVRSAVHDQEWEHERNQRREEGPSL